MLLSNLIYVILFFCTLLILFRFTLLRMYCFNNKDAWLKIDYVYLFLACFGLLSATADTTKILIDKSSRMYSIEYNGKKDIAKWNVSALDKLFNDVYVYDNWKINRNEIPEFKKAAIWYSTLNKLLQDNNDDSGWIKFIHETNTTQNDEPEFVWREKSKVIDQIQKLDALRTIINNLERDRTNIVLFKIIGSSPWLLSVAFALRITRVTWDRRQLLTNKG